MTLELCPRCKTMHYGTDPCRATKSTAARKDVRVSHDAGASVRGRLAEGEGLDATQTVPLQKAGTQAQPVDTKPRRGRPITADSPRAIASRELMRALRLKRKEMTPK